MAQSSVTLHEPADVLSSRTRDMHRAIVSLMEELEAIDWYAQRMEAADDAELKKILAHNGDEEKEHASMVLEWIRRHDPIFDRHLRSYLFTDRPIVGIEQQEEARGDAVSRSGPPSTVGSLRGGGPR